MSHDEMSALEGAQRVALWLSNSCRDCTPFAARAQHDRHPRLRNRAPHASFSALVSLRPRCGLASLRFRRGDELTRDGRLWIDLKLRCSKIAVHQRLRPGDDQLIRARSPEEAPLDLNAPRHNLARDEPSMDDEHGVGADAPFDLALHDHLSERLDIASDGCACRNPHRLFHGFTFSPRILRDITRVRPACHIFEPVRSDLLPDPYARSTRPRPLQTAPPESSSSARSAQT